MCSGSIYEGDRVVGRFEYDNFNSEFALKKIKNIQLFKEFFDISRGHSLSKLVYKYSKDGFQLLLGFGHIYCDENMEIWAGPLVLNIKECFLVNDLKQISYEA